MNGESFKRRAKIITETEEDKNRTAPLVSMYDGPNSNNLTFHKAG